MNSQTLSILILIAIAVWFGRKPFAEGFKEGFKESREERAAKREAENEAARRRHPSSGTMPWAPNDARELDNDR